MISIIIPTLNEEKFLPKLLDSLVAQTDKDFEVIVVDGNSKDKTVTVAMKYIKILHLQIITTTPSLPKQRNIGAQKAKGDWLIFIDADSILFAHFIERVIQYITSKQPSMFTTWMRPDSDEPKDANIALLANLIIETSLIIHKPIGTGPLTAVRRDIFERVGGYDETHSYNEDADFNIRTNKAHAPMDIIPETLYVWSLRRIRQQGTLKVLQQYIISVLPMMLFNKPLKHLPGYFMGGHLYVKKKKSFTRTVIKQYEIKLKQLMKEFLQ